jgi:hypothetical protein
MRSSDSDFDPLKSAPLTAAASTPAAKAGEATQRQDKSAIKDGRIISVPRIRMPDQAAGAL